MYSFGYDHASPNHNVVYCTGIHKPLPNVIHHTQPMNPITCSYPWLSIVSDNATGFVSEELQYFCRHNGIKHITSAPHHPASNGLAERVVGIVKEGVTRMHGSDLETKLARFLFDYRITPHSTTGIAPAELLMHRQLKSRLHLIRPDGRS